MRASRAAISSPSLPTSIALDSAGSLRLLRDGAKLIRDVDDLLEDMKGLRTSAPVRARDAAPPQGATTQASAPPPQLEPIPQQVWDLLAEPKHQDEITRALGLPTGEVSKLLLTLEMKKLIRRGPGNIYERR